MLRTNSTTALGGTSMGVRGIDKTPINPGIAGRSPGRSPCHDASNCSLHHVAVAAVIELDINNPQNSAGNTGSSKHLHGAALTMGTTERRSFVRVCSKVHRTHC